MRANGLGMRAALILSLSTSLTLGVVGCGGDDDPLARGKRDAVGERPGTPGTACGPGAECPPSSVCVSGQCVLVPVPKSCTTPNPAGCQKGGCPKDQVCETGGRLCLPSGCTCDPQTGTWACTPDCSGGQCVPEPAPPPGPKTCSGPSPEGCVKSGCPSGQICDLSGCASSSCQCDPQTGTWVCTPDCSGGQCVPDPQPACPGANPQGCVKSGCPSNQVCKVGINFCASTSCQCQNGWWLCTPDCMGGQCVPAHP